MYRATRLSRNTGKAVYRQFYAAESVNQTASYRIQHQFCRVVHIKLLKDS